MNLHLNMYKPKYMSGLVVALCLALTLASTTEENEFRPELRRSSRIAIIGAGIGGTSAAFEIKQKADKLQIDVDIDIFEEKEIGGRVATIEIKGHRFEVGGAVIHDQNKYMGNYCKTFGLKRMVEKAGRYRMGFFDGEKFVYEESRSKVMNSFRLLWRYGWNLYFLEGLTDQMLKKFSKIYDNQMINGEPYDTVKDLLESMDSSFAELLSLSLHEDLTRKGFRGRLLEEFIFLATNINYNQNLNIHAFVGAVAMAGSSEGKLFSVEGGNERVAEELLSRSGARLHRARVNRLSLSPDGTYGVELEADSHTRTYDIVVLAVPLRSNSPHNIQFHNFPHPITTSEFQYQRTVTTLVHGDLNYTYFGCDEQSFDPRHIFATNDNVFFNSISVLDPVVHDPTYDFKVYKVFSKLPLTESQLGSLFVKYDEVKIVDWLAYPHYDTSGRNPSFVLHKNLFHVNAVEWAASAMEMSVIGAHNVALQVIRALTSQE